MHARGWRHVRRPTTGRHRKSTWERKGKAAMEAPGRNVCACKGDGGAPEVGR